MSGLTPNQIEQRLSTLQPEQQNQFLETLSDGELESYSKLSRQLRPDSSVPGGVLKDQRAVVMRPGVPLEQQPTEVLEAVAAGKLDPDEEITTYLDPKAPKSFFDTGMGGAVGGGLRGALGTVLGLGALPIAAATGSKEPLQAALMAAGAPSDAMGAPRGDDALSRVMFEGFAGAGGGAVLPGVGAGLSRLSGTAPRALGGAMAARPGLQIASGATGSMAGKTSAEGGGDEREQLAASLLGGMVPGMKAGLGAGVRRYLRKDPAAVQSRIDTFEQAGAGTPTVAQATEGPGANKVEALLSKFYPSSSRMQDKIREQERMIGEGLVRRADALGPEQYNSQMGKTILSEAENTVKASGAQHDKMFTELGKLLPPTTVVRPERFGETLDELSSHITGAKNLSNNSFINPDQKAYLQLFQDFKKDVVSNGGQGIPYEAVKKLRTRIGGLIEQSAFEQNPRVGELKRLYGALSEDMKVAADAAGPKARAAFDDANKTVQEWHELLDSVQPVLQRAGGPEKVFTSALSGTKDGGTVIRDVYRVLRPQARQLMTGQILRRMAGDTEDFDMFKFFRQYEKMDGEARGVIFGPMGRGYEADLDAIDTAVRTINKQKENYGLATNPKEGIMGFHYLLGAGTSAPIGFGISAATGSTPGMVFAGSILGGAIVTALGARKAAKFMTNPETVKWLAKSTQVPVEQLPVFVNTELQAARRNGDQEQIAALEALNSKMEQP